MVTYQKNENLQAETQEDGVDKDWEGAHSWLQRYILSTNLSGYTLR